MTQKAVVSFNALQFLHLSFATGNLGVVYLAHLMLKLSEELGLRGMDTYECVSNCLAPADMKNSWTGSDLAVEPPGNDAFS